MNANILYCSQLVVRYNCYVIRNEIPQNINFVEYIKTLMVENYQELKGFANSEKEWFTSLLAEGIDRLFINILSDDNCRIIAGGSNIVWSPEIERTVDDDWLFKLKISKTRKENTFKTKNDIEERFKAFEAILEDLVSFAIENGFPESENLKKVLKIIKEDPNGLDRLFTLPCPPYDSKAECLLNASYQVVSNGSKWWFDANENSIPEYRKLLKHMDFQVGKNFESCVNLE